MFQQSNKNWKITIDKNSLNGGYGDTFGSSISNAIEAKSNEYTKSIAISFLRSGFEGHISAGEGWVALADTNSTITSLPLNATTISTSPGSNGNGFTILQNGRIVQLNLGSGLTSSTYDIPSAISTEFNDITSLFDVAATPIEYLIYSYDTSSNGQIGYIKTDFTSSSPTWITVTKGVPHKFAFGPTKNDLYFINGQYIGTATISGAIASASTNVNALNLGSGWILQSICNYGNYVAVVGHRTTSNSLLNLNESKLWLWDGYSPDPNFMYDLKDNYVSAIINDNGILKIWTYGRNNTLKIKYFTGSKIDILFESAQIGNYPRHGAVDIYNNVPHWTGNLGQNLFYLNGKSLHNRSFITDGTNQASDVGMVKNLYQNILYIGLYTGSAYKIFYLDSGKYYPTADLRTRLFSEIPSRSTIKKIKIYFSQFGSGASILLSLFKDYITTSIGGTEDKLNITISNTIHGNIRYYSFEKQISDLNAFYMNIRFNHTDQSNVAAIIRKIEIIGEGTDLY